LSYENVKTSNTRLLQFKNASSHPKANLDGDGEERYAVNSIVIFEAYKKIGKQLLTDGT
jgi:hypothetical protein